MTSLRCFTAAARTRSFTRAAAELNLTQSAVSRQIARLEAALGVRLFTRSGPYLQLTDRGRAYADAIASPLATIVAASNRFRSEIDGEVITLATLPSFGMRWLAPRLARLTRAFPELVVNLFARSDEFEFAAEVYDAAIHFGRPNWPGARCDYLFGELCLPVISPALLSRQKDSCGLTDLDRIPLLALANRPHAWDEWATQARVSLANRRPAARYEHFAMLAQAALAGVGAALLPQYLIEEELRDGRLVAISPHALTIEGAYFLVYPEERLEKSAFRKFRDWLLAEAEAASSAA